jgi:hypothetical protein
VSATPDVNTSAVPAAKRRRQRSFRIGASASGTVLGFAILVGLGVVVSGWALLGRRQVRS